MGSEVTIKFMANWRPCAAAGLLVACGMVWYTSLESAHRELAPTKRATAPMASQSSTHPPASPVASTIPVSTPGPSRTRFVLDWAMANQRPQVSLAKWVQNSPPDAIHYWKNGELRELSGRGGYGMAPVIPPWGKILNLSDRASIAKIIERRNEEFDHHGHSLFQAAETIQSTPLNGQAYRVASFRGGWRDGGRERVSPPPDLNFAVQGPDHSFEMIDSNDNESLERLRAKTVSLGHRGEIVIKIHGDGEDQGWLFNRPGPDFVIFENAFRLDQDLIYQEFARVGVAETNAPEEYHWFPCHPEKGDILHCAGAVPTDEGGDQFDLSSLNIYKARYIKIQDTGLNHNNFEANTEGFDLDALKLIHAFQGR